MTTRKARPEPTDWVKIINALGTAVVMVMMAFFSVHQRVIREDVAQVKQQTDGSVTASKLAIAISARSLAVSTEKPEDIKRAEEAEAAYEAQVINQRQADQK